jgi:hypothetical protein
LPGVQLKRTQESDTLPPRFLEELAPIGAGSAQTGAVIDPGNFGGDRK